MNQLNNNSQISNEASEAPQLCNNCFEFFGNKSNDFLCSGCFKQRCKEEFNLVKPIVAPIDNSDAKTECNTPSVSHKVSIDEEVLAVEAKPVEVVEEKAKPVEKETNKCNKCSKKVGIRGHKCKCESTFCNAHRLPEDHDCEYDFKQEGLKKLAKDNQAVVASKLTKI